MAKDNQSRREPEHGLPPGSGTADDASVSPPLPSSSVETAVDPSEDALPAARDGNTEGTEQARRTARRRPAGPSRQRLAANDDVPTIGGLIYALEQKPSTKPFQYAAIASGVWTALWFGFSWVMLGPAVNSATSFADFVVKSNVLLIAAAIVVPVSLFFFLALLAWRAEELRLRSSTMTEVAIRLAEPDRMAEQSIASLGQAVRRQVSFMNDAVSRALGRAGELEALVHNEVSALERSYEDNERKIRGLIQELAGERHALVATSDSVSQTLRGLGTEIPALIDKLATQQVTLARIIEGAGQNLTSLETAIAHTTAGLETTVNASAGKLENALGTHATHLQAVLEDYTNALGVALDARTHQMQEAFDSHARAIDEQLGTRAGQIETAFTSNMASIDASLAGRTQALQSVFEEYGRALDTTLARRAEALDSQLVERTKALDDAFSDRLRLFDESILRSTMAIDGSITERSAALSEAMDNHARNLSQTLTKQAGELDETLMHGINSVRRTSEAITRQSIKAIEGLASQSELLKNISENLLGQIGTVTNRFEAQGVAITKAASQLENANYKIDSTLQARHVDLARTLDRLTGKAEEFGQFVQGYSTSIEGSIGDAERRARMLTDELRRDTEGRSRAAVEEIERLRLTADNESQRALADLRERFQNVQGEVTQHLGNLSSRVDATSQEVRQRTASAAAELEAEQQRLREQIDNLPRTTQASSDAMRRALQDQLKAIEHLTALTQREAARRDVSHPVPLPATDIPPGPAPAHAVQMAPPPAPQPAPRSERSRSLSSLTSGLAQELAARQMPAAQHPGGHHMPEPAPPPQSQPGPGAPPPQTAAASGRENWSLGDLLARASVEEDHGHAQGAGPTAETQSAAPAFNVAQLARALDGATAAAIWSKLRTGQRGVMVRSIYTPEGRATFDEVSRRYTSDPSFQNTVNRYLTDFERILRETEQQDPSGRGAQAYANSETGRVYLFLAHASGRLA